MKKFGLFLVTIMTAFFITTITLPINASGSYTISVNTSLSHIGVGDVTSVNATVSPSSLSVTWKFEKGAHFVLGTTLTTHVPDSNNFLSGFLNGIECGYSIEGCIAQGISQAGDQVPRPDLETGKGTYPIVYVGDTQQYFH